MNMKNVMIKFFTISVIVILSLNNKAYAELCCDTKENTLHTTIFYYTEAYEKACGNNFDIPYMNKMAIKDYVSDVIKTKDKNLNQEQRKKKCLNI